MTVKEYTNLNNSSNNLNSFSNSISPSFSVVLSVICGICGALFSYYFFCGKLSNIRFFVIFCFAFCFCFLISFCLFDNIRFFKRYCPIWIEGLFVASIFVWLGLNYLEERNERIGYNPQMLFRYRIPFFIFLLVVLFLFLVFVFLIRITEKITCKNYHIFRFVVVMIVSILYASTVYAPNVFGSSYELWHAHAYDNSIYDIFRLVPYSEVEKSIYGHYAIFFLFPGKLLHLFGVPYNIVVALLIACSAFIMYFSVLYVINKLVKNHIVFFFFVLALSECRFQFGQGIYWQMSPHRLMFPCLIVALVMFWKSRNQKNNICSRHLFSSEKSFVSVLFVLESFSLIWNTETGIVCIIASELFLVFERIKNDNSTKLNSIMRISCIFILRLILSVSCAYGIVNLYNSLCGGNVLNFREFIYPLLSNTYEISNLELSLPNWKANWFGCSILFLCVLVYCFVKCIKHDKNMRYSLYILVSLLGLGTIFYYINRASNGNLYICYPEFLIILSGILDDLILCKVDVFDKSSVHKYKSLVRNFFSIRNGLKYAISLVCCVLATGVVGMDNVFESKKNEIWNTEKIDEFVAVLDNDIPEGTIGLGLGVPELYAMMDRDPGIHLIDWADINNRGYEYYDYVNSVLKDETRFFARVEDMISISESRQFSIVKEFTIGSIKYALYERTNNFDEFKGNGTKENPYLIENASDLKKLSDYVNSGFEYGFAYFFQTNDIDLINYDNWVPIGVFDCAYSFKGCYDGGGHKIFNLRIDSSYLNNGNVGLFGKLGGTVCNLGIESGEIIGACVGSIASHSFNDGSQIPQIINCYNKATITGTNRAGGIVDNFSSGFVICCINYGEVNQIDNMNCAGIVSYNSKLVWGCFDNNSIINESYFTGNCEQSFTKQLLSSDLVNELLSCGYKYSSGIYDFDLIQF